MEFSFIPDDVAKSLGKAYWEKHLLQLKADQRKLIAEKLKAYGISRFDFTLRSKVRAICEVDFNALLAMLRQWIDETYPGE